MTPSNLDDFPSHLVRHCHLWNSARWTAVCMLLLCECSRSLHVSVALPVVTLGYDAIRRIWPDYGKYLSPEILYIPYKWFAPQTPLKKIRKIRGKYQAKAIQEHVPCLNLKNIFQISFSQYANNVGTPLFRSMRQAQITDTHALNQQEVSQNSSPLWSNFTADKHIWHPPWAWM